MDYHIKPAARVCAATGRAFQPGEQCHSVLVERDGQLLRLDYAAEAWNGPPQDSLGDWLTQIPDDGAKSKTLDTESLFRYFEQLCEDANPAHDRLRYVLALLLLQKRRLRLEGAHRDEDDNDFLDLIGSKSEGPYQIPDQSLDEDEIAQLQAGLSQQLEEEWS
ncbi:hypothetical protein GC176_19550 [bacterium]|nr:hypothetical protein [bacterium]